MTGLSKTTVINESRIQDQSSVTWSQGQGWYSLQLEQGSRGIAECSSASDGEWHEWHEWHEWLSVCDGIVVVHCVRLCSC